eukprot:1082328-Alexandrium_andersonii.AAC.1
MSASLVGSEMCIRDRLSDPSVRLSGPESRTEESESRTGAPRAGWGHFRRRCLLITRPLAQPVF